MSRAVQDSACADLPDILENISLAPWTTIGVGGLARYFAKASSIAELQALLVWSKQQDVDIFVLGGGSNLVCSDRGFPGLVIRMELKGIEETAENAESTLLTVAAGEIWDQVVEHAVKRALQGIEGLSGIPGLAGATPIQNVGAYGQEVKDVIEKVMVVERSTGLTREFGNSDCRFGYRMSRFKAEDAGRFIVTGIVLRLHRSTTPQLRYGEVTKWFEKHEISSPTLLQAREAVLEIRAGKAMVIDPKEPNSRSCGSFFMNPVVNDAQLGDLCERLLMEGVLSKGELPPSYPAGEGLHKLSAAWLIERSGIQKGFRLGRAGVSAKHVLALVNCGEATASEIRALAELIRQTVSAKFGVELYPEPVFVGFDD